LDSEKIHALSLKKDAVGALERAQEAEEEIVLLKGSREADEATIENLKHMFENLRQSQMQSLAELNSKVSASGK
jgi:hypothetical protein